MCTKALLLEGNRAFSQFSLSNMQNLHSQVEKLQLPAGNLKNKIIPYLNCPQNKFDIYGLSGWEL